jgi:hypothetical protein
MKRSSAILIALLAALIGICSAEPVVVATSPAPERHFELVLSTDKDQPDYEKLEMKEDSFPKVWLRHRASGKVLAAFNFPADVNSDLQPLRDHIHADWSETAVAISASERHYSHLLVFALVGTCAQPERFVKVEFPALGDLIKAVVPKFKEFRSRWHTDFQGWPDRNLIMFSSGTSSMTSERADGQIEFRAVYSFTFDISDPTAPILRRIEPMDAKD